MKKTVTIETTKDTGLYSDVPTTNYGASTLIYVSTSNLRHGIFGFDLSTIPEAAIITAASFQAYYASLTGGDPVGNTVSCYRVTRNDWVENQATWYIYKTGSNWSTGGGDYTGDAVSITFPGSYGWMTWDVRDHVLISHRDYAQKCTLLLKATNTGAGSYPGFESIERAGTNVAYLTITYEMRGLFNFHG